MDQIWAEVLGRVTFADAVTPAVCCDRHESAASNPCASEKSPRAVKPSGTSGRGAGN